MPRATRAAEAAALEARALAQDLRELHDEHGVAWRDVGVLFRSRGEWDIYLGALREAAIPFSVEGDRTYYRRREILDAAAFVCCVLDPNDQLALLTLLRSTAAGIPDAAWIPLWEAGFPALAARLGSDPEALAALEPLLDAVADGLAGTVPGLERLPGWQVAAFACLEAIAGLRLSFESDPGDVFVERLRAALCFEAIEAARFLGAWRAANLERFFADLAEGLAAGEPVGSLLRRVRRAVAEEETPSAEPAAPGSLDAVTVVTQHGAKGLDWEHVYLMQLHKGEARGAAPGEVGRVDGELEACWCGWPTLGFDVVAERRMRVAAAERVRTLYVGMTRARRRLVLSGLWSDFAERGGGESHAALLERRDPAPPDWLALAASAADGRVEAANACWVIPALRAAQSAATAPDDSPPRDDIADRDDAQPVALAIGAARPLPDAERRMALRAGATVTELAALGEHARDATPGTRGSSASERSARAARRSRAEVERVGRLVGTAIHAALERLDLGAEPAAQWCEQRARIAAGVRAAALPGDCEAAIADALACWDALGAGPLSARLRGLALRVVARELPILLPPIQSPTGADAAAVGFVSGTIDLLYRDEDDGFVVVDYKTDRHEPGEPGSDGGARRERYARQGELYCRAVGQALGTDPAPRFEIWWLRSGVVDALPDPRAAGAPDR